MDARALHRSAPRSEWAHTGERASQSVEQDLADGQMPVTLVRALDHIPRRITRRGLPQQALPQIVPLAVDAVRIPVGAGDAPARARIAIELLKPLLLSGLRQV